MSTGDSIEKPLQRTFVMMKPDGVQRSVTGEIIQRLEKRGLKLVGLKMCQPTEQLVKNLYEDLKEKFYYTKLLNYIMMGPVICMVWEGFEAVRLVRSLQGATYPIEAEPASLRGSHCQVAGRTVLHASDSVPSAHREIHVWFSQEEVFSWTKSDEPWTHEQTM